MPAITLERAQDIVKAALAAARTRKLKPMAVVVLDARGSIRALASEDGAAIGHPNIAVGKANAALSVNIGTRALAQSAADMPYYVAGLVQAVGAFIPLPGGVLLREDGHIVGAVGVTGDSADNDEIIAVEAALRLNFEPDTGVQE